ncbi:MAG: hypothetical protein AAF772_11680 [Acidobacteriota bacterium]
MRRDAGASKRRGLALLGVAAPLALVACALPVDAGGDVLFALAAGGFPVALMMIGACRDGRLGRTAWPLALLALLLGAIGVGLFAYRGRVLDGPWWGGLPMAAAIQLYGLFLLPLAITAFGYAWTFDQHGLRSDDLAALRRRFPTPRAPEDP